MSLSKEITKIIFKFLDKNLSSSFYPKLINRNSSKMYKNNYKVSDDFDYIFVHIPKTGGMTLNNIIDSINSKLQNKKLYKGGHNPISLFHSMNEKKYFTVIRDPIDRVYSFFNMALNDKKQTYNYLAKKGLYDFTAYCEESQNTYCKFFSGEIEKNVNDDTYKLAEENIKKFFKIINFSNYEKDLRKFFNNIGHENIEIPHINISKKNHITSDEKRIIEFYNYYDLKLYKFLIQNKYI